MKSLSKPQIIVCILTYKRQNLLEKLLLELNKLNCEDKFNYSVVIIDNECSELTEQLVCDLESQLNYQIVYKIESNRNIACARNLALKSLNGDYYAFIDDDEYPDPKWLLNLYNCLNDYNVGVVAGPVDTYFEHEPPVWIRRSILFSRLVFKTGVTFSRSMGTGNCLIKRELIEKYDVPFDVRFGLTGGEDTDLFLRIRRDGGTFAWCQEAVVYEFISKERASLLWMIRRAFRVGTTTTAVWTNKRSFFYKLFRYFMAHIKFVLLSVLFPFFVLAALFDIRYLSIALFKMIFYIGEVFGFFKVRCYEYA